MTSNQGAEIYSARITVCFTLLLSARASTINTGAAISGRGNYSLGACLALVEPQ
jgi:hypothetical protein